MTIIHIITGLGGGGAEHVVLELSKSSIDRSIDTLVIPVSDVSAIEGKFRDLKIPLFFLHINSAKHLPTGLKRLHSQIKDLDDAVFHCHMFHAFFVALLYSIFYRKIPIVFTLHNNKISSLTRRLIMFFSKSFRKFDIIFSENSKKWYLKNNAVVPNGIDLNKFACQRELPLSESSHSFDFLFLGSLTEQKNPLVLPKLAQKLEQQQAGNFRIKVVGDGPMRQPLIEAIRSENLEGKIELLGFRNDVDQLLKQSHCMIMPSLWEGMPVSIIEAGATKLPVIVTPVGSIPDFLNSSNAYVVNTDQFPQTMEDVMGNYEEALKKGNKLFQLVSDKFSIEAVFNTMHDIYKKAV